jgi:hypothetical protein
MSMSCKDQSGVTLIDQIDGFLIADRPPGLDDRGDAGVEKEPRTIREREKGVTRRYRSRRTCARFFDGDSGSADAIHLSTADPDGGLVLGQDDGVAFDVFDRDPS